MLTSPEIGEWRAAGSMAGRSVDMLITRMFFGISCVGCLAETLIVWWHYAAVPVPWRGAVVAQPLVIIGAIAAGCWMARRGRLAAGVSLVLLSAWLSVSVTSVASGLGLGSLMLSLYSPLIIVAGVMLGVPGALVFTALCVFTLLVLAGWPGSDLATQAAQASSSTFGLLLVHAALVGISLMSGVLMSRALVTSLRETKYQEHRFRQLLDMATNWYWEMDEQFRFTSVEGLGEGPEGLHAARAIGRRPWEGVWPQMSEQQWAVHKAGLATHQPIRNALVGGGAGPYYNISAEPLVSTSGKFLGYWGVSRTETANILAKQRLKASEQLYRAMFERASTGFAFHREGRIRSVNAALASMLGFESPEEMVGIDIRDHVDPGHHELLRRLSLQLESGGIGTSLPFIDMVLRRRDGMRVDVLLSAVRVAMPEGVVADLAIFVDVTQRKETERLLTAARDQAEAASRTMSRFLANISHEIRTPLSGVYGLAQLGLDEQVSEPQRRQYLRHIVSSARHLTTLLSDVLDLAKVEAGELTVERVAFDLRALLEEASASYLELASAKGLRLESQVGPDVPGWVLGDPTRVRQVVANFIGNAIKFTGSGCITLGASATPGEGVTIRVRDSGIGIDAAEVEKLFRRFSQADDSTTRRFGGSGLGLSICRELATLMGGTVGVHSVVGEGSTFWVRLPLTETVPQPEGSEGAAPSLAGVRVLLAEDNPVNLLIAQSMLCQAGALVTAVGNGRQALDAFDATGGAFDAVLLDLHMPVMDGLEAARELRRHRNAQWLPILVITAAVTAEDRERALAAGMNDFIAKPFSRTQLLVTVKRWLDACGPGEQP